MVQVCYRHKQAHNCTPAPQHTPYTHKHYNCFSDLLAFGGHIKAVIHANVMLPVPDYFLRTYLAKSSYINLKQLAFVICSAHLLPFFILDYGPMWCRPT